MSDLSAGLKIGPAFHPALAAIEKYVIMATLVQLSVLKCESIT